ncbi:non-heme iron oxygenase ferredoxin subunit [Luteococcus peritonei]|uniref:Non-heme iron oxygenase ferredoxin subunit n=1 Tax=Luteococcus peritonei TaxID=88874 RepID=A0ABW4RTT8_9ACTN
MSFVDACELAELTDLPLGVEVGDAELAIVKVGEEIFAITDECSHGKVPLSEGDVVDCSIECYLHGSAFDLRTGAALNLPATEPVPVYPTRVVDGMVQVDLDNPIDPAALA